MSRLAKFLAYANGLTSVVLVGYVLMDRPALIESVPELPALISVACALMSVAIFVTSWNKPKNKSRKDANGKYLPLD